MNFHVIHVSRGDMMLKSEGKYIRVLGEALVASAPTERSQVIYLDSLNKWEAPADVSLTETEKQHVLKAIRKYFQDRGSIIEFE